MNSKISRGPIQSTGTITAKTTVTATAVTSAAPSGSIIFDTFVNGQYQINRVRADGSGLTLLFAGASEPALSPNGTVLAYHKRSGAGGVGVAIASLTGAGEKIVANASNAGYPSWSSDGNNLVYHLTPSGALPGQIWKITKDGTDPVQVGLGVRPAWQPGGSQTVIFDGCDANGGNCYSLHTGNAFTPDPNNPTFIVRGTNAAWSPSGQQIAFQDTDANGNVNIFIANRDGSGKHQITKGTSHDGLPIWSADGQWLFYRSDQNGTSWAIYAIRVDGTNEHKIVDAPVNASDWVYEKLAIAP